MIDNSVPILLLLFVCLFLDVKSHVFDRLNRSDVAEFDLTAEENRQLAPATSSIGEQLKTKIAHGYELLGHKISQIGRQLEENRENLTNDLIKTYSGPVVNRTSILYEQFQYGSGKMGDTMSSVLHWLGDKVIRVGHQVGNVIRYSFHTIGDLVGGTVDRTEQFIGNELIRSSEKVHEAAIDLEETSHRDGEDLREKLLNQTPELRESIDRIIGRVGHQLDALGRKTEVAGEVIDEEHFLDTLKRIE